MYYCSFLNGHIQLLDCLILSRIIKTDWCLIICSEYCRALIRPLFFSPKDGFIILPSRSYLLNFKARNIESYKRKLMHFFASTVPELRKRLKWNSQKRNLLNPTLRVLQLLFKLFQTSCDIYNTVYYCLLIQYITGLLIHYITGY